MKFGESIQNLIENTRSGANNISLSDGDLINIVSSESITMEIEYNFGRTFHAMGFAHLALHHYRAVLEMAERFSSSNLKFDESILKRSAFNAVIILKSSDSLDEAIEITDKYLSF